MKEFDSINDILDFAIGKEQSAVDFYNDLASKLPNEVMRKVFEEFAQEEMKHKAKLIAIKEQGIFEVTTEKIMDLKIADFTAKKQPEPNMTYQDALIVAMNNEKHAFKLYSRLAEKAPTAELQSLFMMLAQEESKHKLRFELEYDEYVLREN
jgi:rubrerythrin